MRQRQRYSNLGDSLLKLSWRLKRELNLKLGWMVFILTILTGSFCITTAKSQTTSGAQPAMQIVATSSPYHIEWNGTSGTFVKDALGAVPAVRLPMVFLHTDPGPKGYAKHLAWFLARGTNSFSLLWCYLNNTGDDFYCWLYRFPDNQLTTLHFQGRYSFTVPTEPTAPVTIDDLKFTTLPSYTGPDFFYNNWTRQSGQLASVPLYAPVSEQFMNSGSPVSLTGNTDSTVPSPAAKSIATLTNLNAFPLHEIHVANGNGWREGGWRELHALAYDAKNSPYYLILYSNSTRGYVIDLRNAQTFSADFGKKVVFSNNTVFGAKEDTISGPPELNVPKFVRQEITLIATQHYDDPYSQVLLDTDVIKPDGKRIVVPGFWDGGSIWHVRIAPTDTGLWRWRTRSNDPGLDGQEGVFTCVAGTNRLPGFLMSSGSNDVVSQVSRSEGAPFLPVLIAYPLHHDPTTPPTVTRGEAVPILVGNTPGSKATLSINPNGSSLTLIESTPQGAVSNRVVTPADTTLAPKSQPLPLSSDSSTMAADAIFRSGIDALAAAGFNRLIGEYLIDKNEFNAKTQHNTSGPICFDYDPDRINPAYFQEMDRRIAYCNSKGIVPDIGIGMLDDDLFKTIRSAQMNRLWRYVLARYASYDVCWNLFGRAIGSRMPVFGDTEMMTLVDLTQRFDPCHHLLTTVLPGSTVSSAASSTTTEVSPAPVPVLPSGAPNPLSGASAPPFSDRNNRRNNERNQASNDSSYIVSPAGLTLRDVGLSRNIAPLIATPDADQSWLDVITLSSGPVSQVTADAGLGKPIAIYDSSVPSSPDAARYRLWETRMAGGYWAANYANNLSKNPSMTSTSALLASPDNQWAAICGKLFARTRYWRLMPHNEMLGGPNESAFDRRRRLQVTNAANKAEGADRTPAPNSDIPITPHDLKPQVNGPIFILSDPSWEYLIYFEKGGTLTLELLEATGTIRETWLNPRTGEVVQESTLEGGDYKNFKAPDANDWVLYLSRR